MKKVLSVIISIILIAAFAAASMAAVKPDEVYAKHGMVSAANELASKAGVEIMQKGGNAIDAAVATALALNVVEFNASGIGGGGFMTIRDSKTGETVCLDYRETAPASSTKDMYASEASKKAKESIVRQICRSSRLAERHDVRSRPLRNDEIQRRGRSRDTSCGRGICPCSDAERHHHR